MKEQLEKRLRQLAGDILKAETGDLEKWRQSARELYENLTIQAYLKADEKTGEKEAQPVPEQTIAEPAIEKIKDMVEHMPRKPQELGLGDMEVHYTSVPDFERKEPASEVKKEVSTPAGKPAPKGGPPADSTDGTGGISIGLNDRLAFVNQLFGGNVDDYNRATSQLATMGSFREAKHFVENALKPDYNNWKGKELYAERFMNIIKKRFQ